MGALFTEVWIAGCKVVHLAANEHKMLSLADVFSLEGCEIWWMSQSEGLESLSMSLTWPSILQAMESSVEIVYENLEDVMKLPEIVIFNIFFQEI